MSPPRLADLPEESGNLRVFICPYHAWAYNLNGSLRAARDMPPEFDPAALGLKEIHIRLVEGLIFISFAATPLRMREAEETLRSGLGPYGWATAKVAHREVYAIEANWKLAVENYVECYHSLPPIRSIPDPFQRPAAPQDCRAQRGDERTDHCPRLHHSGDRPLGAAGGSGEEPTWCMRFALTRGAVSGSEDGKPVAPLMGHFTDYDGGATYVHVGPLSLSRISGLRRDLSHVQRRCSARTWRSLGWSATTRWRGATTTPSG